MGTTYANIPTLELNVLDLFSGIGGFAAGFHRIGFKTVAFCESSPFARAVLAKTWPEIPCYHDVRNLTARQMRSDGVAGIDVVCGGFPCQDISAAGQGAGLDGVRSGLWREMLRLVTECRPGWVVVENVPALRIRGADRVLDGLEAAGYACWPLVVGAAHAGAPHRRQRVFVLAHADGTGLEERLRRTTRPAPVMPAQRCRGWPVEPGVGRMADGVPARVDRLRALGNAVMPDVTEMIAQAIVSVQAAADFTRSPNSLRNLATLGPTTARQ